jgi:hypothetical protein
MHAQEIGSYNPLEYLRIGPIWQQTREVYGWPKETKNDQ